VFFDIKQATTNSVGRGQAKHSGGSGFRAIDLTTSALNRLGGILEGERRSWRRAAEASFGIGENKD
jgi:hypothetical protein